jgi:cytochrome d ubiquinol oxidase subunit II
VELPADSDRRDVLDAASRLQDHRGSLTDAERRISMNSIGPLWDGNEVWLVTFGGALFAAFPEAYATVFSGFYTAFMLLLFSLILRAVSLEFRSKRDSPAWRGLWDTAFFGSSLLATLLFGVAVGNAMVGMPLDARGNSTASLLDQLNPYALVVGLFAVTLFALHGSIFLYLKTDGELQERARRWFWRCFAAFLLAYAATSIYTLAAVPHATDNLKAYPIAWLVPLLNVLAIANIPRAIHRERPGYAFISSACTIAAFVFLFAVALYPNMVPATDPANALTIFSTARSSALTLEIMLLIAVIGMPCVLAYTTAIYWTFRGKVKLGEHSY